MRRRICFRESVQSLPESQMPHFALIYYKSALLIQSQWKSRFSQTGQEIAIASSRTNHYSYVYMRHLLSQMMSKRVD